VLLRNTLIFLVVLFLALFIWLLAGIKLDTLKVADFNVDGLYIKLDKKLTLKADHVTIPKSKADPSFDSVHDTFERIKYVLTFFDYIELKKLAFDNNILSIIFSHDILWIDSQDYRISGNISREGTVLKSTVPIFTIKEHNLTMSGKITYDLDEDILTTEGQFLFNDITGVFNAKKEKDEINFTLNSNTFTDLRPVISKFELEEAVRSWIVEKVEAKSYKLLSLSGKGSLKNEQFKMDLGALKGEALFSETKIHFKENLEPVLVPSFILTYKNGGLYFDLRAPTYENISLKGSEVSILNLLNPDTNLKLKIRTNTRFDSKIQNLLKAYDLIIPLNQTRGKVTALFMADLSLKNQYKDFYVNVDFDKGDIWLEKIKLSIEKGNLQYKNGVINLKNIYLKDTLYEGNINGNIYLDKKKAELVFDAKSIELGDMEKRFFVLKDLTLPFELSFGDNIEIDIPKLHIKLTSDHNETHIFLTDINKIKPYLPDPGPIEQGGNVDIETKDFKTFTFKGMLKRTSCFLYEKEDQCRSRVPFEGKVTPTDLDFYAFSKRFYYNQASSRVKITNLNIDLEAFLTSTKKKTKSDDRKKKSKVKQGKPFIILGKKSHLRYGEYSLITDSYDIEIKPNGDIKAIGSSSNDIIKFSRKRDIFSIQALRIKDKALHPLINFKGLKDGRYTLKSSGNPEKTMNGKIIVEGGVMKDFKAYNNTLAFINTIPALASLQNPGYSTNGFTIEKGVAEYSMIRRDKIVFDSIYIKGTSATIAGTGEIDLTKKTINLNLVIQTARELGKVVGNLPLVGYILMGEDKSMTIGLQITGTLDDPQVKTSAGQELLTLPLQILKRALESPSHIINKPE
jgi:hypothetical protein